MPGVAVVGAQWGDEGKGKIVDYLVDRGYRIVARYNGGPNAGHTTYKGGRKVVLHVIPSAISHPNVTCVIGNDVVIDPLLLLKELDDIGTAGISAHNLRISEDAKVITPYEKALERLSPSAREIGTTGRGIGTTYMTHAARVGLSVSDFFYPDKAMNKLKRLDEEFLVNQRLENSGEARIDPAKVADDYAQMFRQLGPHVKDTVHYLNGELKKGAPMIFEGAQGTFLDVDFGTHPFVTSSHPISGGVAAGLGIPPSAVTEVAGVMKAGYLTRVGGGPLLGELGTEQSIKGDKRLSPGSQEFLGLKRKVANGTATEAELGKYLRDEGDEYGASTGRPRRVAWPDVPLIEYAAMINGINWLALTKIDVSDFVPETRFITSHNMDGGRVHEFNGRDYGCYRPVFGYTVHGSMRSNRGMQKYDDLSKSARTIVDVWNDIVPVRIVSTGPESHETIFLR